MRTTDHPRGHGLLACAAADAPRPADPLAARRRGKRNPWVVLAFFGLVVMSWLNS